MCSRIPRSGKGKSWRTLPEDYGKPTRTEKFVRPTHRPQLYSARSCSRANHPADWPAFFAMIRGNVQESPGADLSFRLVGESAREASALRGVLASRASFDATCIARASFEPSPWPTKRTWRVLARNRIQPTRSTSRRQQPYPSTFTRSGARSTRRSRKRGSTSSTLCTWLRIRIRRCTAATS